MTSLSSHIQQLRHWPLAKLLEEKYDFTNADAEGFAAFLLPMLKLDPLRRATAAESLVNLQEWLVV